MWKFASRLALVGSVIAVGAFAVARGEGGMFSPYVDGSGGITLPDPASVRARWSYLGIWAVQGEEGVDELHAVYTQPGTIDAFRKTGEFPDSAVLMKEVRKATHGAMTTGDIAWNDEEVLWFVMVKDRKGRFPDNPIWAKEWGWALFLAEDRETNAATDFRVDCMGCHVPAKTTEWVYTQGYPVLRD